MPGLFDAAGARGGAAVAIADAERQHHADDHRHDQAADAELGNVEVVDDDRVDSGGARPERDPVIHCRSAVAPAPNSGEDDDQSAPAAAKLAIVKAAITGTV